jgi:hypothetical protein
MGCGLSGRACGLPDVGGVPTDSGGLLARIQQGTAGCGGRADGIGGTPADLETPGVWVCN